MIIDAHTHISDTDYGNIDIYEKESSVAGIDKSILFPGGSIDVRKMTRYITMKDAPPKVPFNNKLIGDIVKRNPDKYRAFMGINPKALNTKDTLDILEKGVKEEGFVGLKLSPTSHQLSFFDATVQELFKLCGELGIPVYAHTGFGAGISTDDFAACAKDFPETNFILGHMGFGPADIDAVMHVKALDNLFIETSGGSSIIIKQAFKILGDNKMIFGSEYPMHSIKSELTKVEELEIYGNLDNILYKNIQNLVKLS
ncbi:amidohydrolase family protein [Vallitalea maricola]|uniref:Amidohydrolase family protein n=1 Tax=Vallitalea maricola TaxID=3074433 RepID=A0ACB5UGG3_9FIRM|nr:amidohydrolase family protein [Vallitalea sp. AN17-2]